MGIFGIVGIEGAVGIVDIVIRQAIAMAQHGCQNGREHRKNVGSPVRSCAGSGQTGRQDWQTGQ